MDETRKIWQTIREGMKMKTNPCLKVVALARRPRFGRLLWWLVPLCLWPPNCPAGGSTPAEVTNTFPSVAEVIGGHTFENLAERDIFFLRAIHDRYHDQWADLLAANLNLKEYVLSPEKQLRFITELGEAMRGRNDPDACTNLFQLIGDPAFYAAADVDRPEITVAAAQALIQLGPEGQKALAAAFSETHYRTDPVSLERLAGAIGAARPDHPDCVRALAATAFDFSTTNGAFYPVCTKVAVQNLLCLGGGPAAVQARLQPAEVLDNPARFGPIVEGINTAQAAPLSTNLAALQAHIQPKLAALTNSPGGYRDDLQALDVQIGQRLKAIQAQAQPVTR